MRIFVAYGYNPRDRWIESVFPSLIEAFGSDAIDGHELEGQLITEGVRQSIKDSDALLAFFTRRGDPIAEGKWNTHSWVRDEFICALENNKLVVEVYEDGVTREPGMGGSDRQYVRYQEEQRLDCVVNIVKLLGRWHQRGTRRFQLVPNPLIRPHVTKNYFRCRYRVMEGTNESPPHDVTVQRIQGGLFINADGLTRESLIQVEIVTDNGTLSSDYTSIDAISIQME